MQPFPLTLKNSNEFQAKSLPNIHQTAASTIRTIPNALAMSQPREVDNGLPKMFVAHTL